MNARRIKYTPFGSVRADSVGYSSYRKGITNGAATLPVSGERHTRYGQAQLVTMSREFYRDNAIYRHMIDKAVAYTIGAGFVLQARTEDQEYNKTVEKLWREFWNEEPEIKGQFSGKHLEKLICRELILAGDVLCLIVNADRTLKLQVIESEQIAKSGCESGVVTNEFGKPTAFYVAEYTKNGVLKYGKTPKNASNCIFVCDLDRPSAVRGIPAAQASFSMLHRINDVCDSEALAWQILSRLALSITRERGPESAFVESEAENELDFADRIQELDWGLIFHGEPGDKIAGIDRNIPGQNFTQSLEAFLRLLGLPLGLPLEIVLLDWTKSNYSQSRAVLQQAYEMFTDRQDLLETKFYCPVYKRKVSEWVASGLLPDIEDKYCHEWVRPRFPWIDPYKESQALGEQIDRGLISLTGACKEVGIEVDTVRADREREIIEAINAAKRIEEETGVLISWEILAGMKDRKTVTEEAPTEKPESKNEDLSDGS